MLSAGSVEEVNLLRGDATRTIDLDGRVAVLGLNDAHMHLLPLGIGVTEVGLRAEEGVRSIDEFLRRVAEDVKTKKPGEWSSDAATITMSLQNSGIRRQRNSTGLLRTTPFTSSAYAAMWGHQQNALSERGRFHIEAVT